MENPNEYLHNNYIVRNNQKWQVLPDYDKVHPGNARKINEFNRKQQMSNA